MDTTSVNVSNETYAVAAELRKTVTEVGSALASSQTVDAPPVSVCVDAYCLSGEKRSPRLGLGLRVRTRIRARARVRVRVRVHPNR